MLTTCGKLSNQAPSVKAGTPEHIFERGLGMSCKSILEYPTTAVVGRQ